MARSTLSKLPPADEIHAELLATLAHATTLRQLLRLRQRAERQRQQTHNQQQRADGKAVSRG